MEKEQRNRLQKATQDARKLLEEEFRSQLLQTYDIDVEKVRWAEEPGAHLQAEQRLIREKLVAWIEHKEAQINDRKEALLLALRELAFTALNRFVALKLMEARELVRPCVSGGLESAGFLEFTAVAQGLLADQESSYRLYLETIFEDVSCELRALFDPRDPASLLWPKRTALLELLEILNRPELAGLWSEDETLGWVYQYFNGDAERKQMREESSAPRNSRELAVRNQFFTPRYVVEFLTDNTLGRIWYEMRQANTGLKDRCRYLVRRPNEIWLQPGEDSPAQPDADETLSQEELLRQPVYIPHRSLKDPREIRMLDPACGSMHFGLYAFDLYLEIYNEAWEIAQGSDEQSKQEEAFSPFVAYAAGFADKAVFLREVPKLILQHNIHGIDIDPRATQIARLTLWLRAQRAWQKQRVEVADRPPVTRSNVACAEPMPGERGLLANFVDQQFPETERGLVRELLEAIFDKMQLAGEAGSLLKIEEEIRDAIAQARREWQKLDIQQRDLFSAAELAALGKVGSSPNTEDLQSLTHNFWIDIEERIYAALRHYAKQAEDDGGLRRKLFADDAAQGFAFIDVCRKRYSAVLMNPPFGQGTERYYEELRGQYQGAHHDIYAAFVRRANQLSPLGRVGAITSRSFLSAPRLEQFRVSEVLPRISIISDFGLGVMDDAYVESAAYVLGDLSVNQFSVFDLRSSAPFHASDALLSQIENGGRPCQARHYLGLPKARILYTLPASIRRLMMHGEPFEPSAGTAREGMKSFNNDRYLRTWWEVPCSEIGVGRSWVRMAKGGGYALYYSEFPLVLNWKNSGAELQETNRQINNSTAQVRQASSYWHRPGLTYSKRSAKGFSARVLPAEFVFTSNGPAILLGAADQISPAGLLAWVNSRFVRALIQLQANFGDYSSGSIKNLPWMPSLSARDASRLDELAKDLIYRRRCLLKRLETSCAFDMQLLNTSRNSNEILGDREAWDCIESQLARSIDEIVERAYANHESEWITEVLTDKESSDLDMEAEDEEDNLDSHVESAIPGVCMGVAFGRWDIRNATGKRAAPDLPDPFASLPVCPPGQLQNAQGLPAGPEDAPATYPISISWDGILLDDPNHPLDIDRHVREVIEIICSDLGSARAQSIEQEVCEILGVNSLREWFRSPSNFFADHLKHYSKSRRQAPIYWQLSPGSGSYSVWLYYHRFTQDTLYHVLRDFVEPRIQQAERELFELEFQGALSGDAATRLQEARALLQDLRIFKAELDLVAPLWNPNLNDGVIINHAILWRITPYTPWQKKCKECWDKLVKGDYDWAHLAFHLWPERVIPKCTTDRSLAIAHGLEERLWQETNNGNWLPRQLSEADLQALIAEHSNPAVKSALERFLAAPPPVAPTRTRASRSTRASGSATPRRARGSAAVVDAEATRQVLLALTAAPSDGLAKTQIADLIGVEANALTAVIKQLKESGQIDQLGERRGARYVLSEQGQAAVAADAGGDA